MAIRAYVLIEAEVGTMERVGSWLANLPAVETCDLVTGPYDVIAVVTAADMASVGELITVGIHQIHGVVRTTTCLSTG